jgi:hypothetical protein
MAIASNTTLVRVLICYLIAAGIHTLAVAVASKPPHSGMGPLVIFFVLFFWATPLMTVVQLFQGDDPAVYDITVAKRISYFVVPFAVALLIAFRRELSQWRRSGDRTRQQSDV